MNPLLASASSVVLTVLTDAGAALADVQKVQAFVVYAVQLAEQTGADGETKLAAVLNATETFVNNALPTLKADWNALAVQVKTFVAGLVSLWNALGVFVSTAAKDVGQAITEVKASLTPPAPPAPLSAANPVPLSPPQPAG